MVNPVYFNHDDYLEKWNNDHLEEEKLTVNTYPYKVKNSFIYSSCPTRGLKDVLLWFILISKLAECGNTPFTLNIFVDFETEYVKKNCNVNELKEMIKKIDGVTLHKRVAKEELYKYMMKTEYWLYNTTFVETFCITAVEIQNAGCIAIHTGIGALSEVNQMKPVLTAENAAKLLTLLYENPKLKIKKMDEAIENGNKFNLENCSSAWFDYLEKN